MFIVYFKPSCLLLGRIINFLKVNFCCSTRACYLKSSMWEVHRLQIDTCHYAHPFPWFGTNGSVIQASAWMSPSQEGLCFLELVFSASPCFKWHMPLNDISLFVVYFPLKGTLLESRSLVVFITDSLTRTMSEHSRYSVIISHISEGVNFDLIWRPPQLLFPREQSRKQGSGCCFRMCSGRAAGRRKWGREGPEAMQRKVGPAASVSW